MSLSDNVLDGSYVPASGDVGIWGTTISDANGNLGTPFVATITEEATIGAFRLIGSQYVYPVAFTIKFYNAKFHISEKLYNKYNSLTDQTTKDLFCNKIVFKYYEPYMINYLHSIKEILKYTNDYIYRKKSISRYMNIFITSMSYKELFFIQNYAKYNKRFGKCIETCKLDKIIEAELSNK